MGGDGDVAVNGDVVDDDSTMEMLRLVMTMMVMDGDDGVGVDDEGGGG